MRHRLYRDYLDNLRDINVDNLRSIYLAII